MRIGGCGGPPRDAVRVDAAIAVVAVADALRLLHRKLERLQWGVTTDVLCSDLICRRAVSHVGTFGLLGMNAAQPHRSGARVLAVTIALRLGLLLTQADWQHELILERLERSQRAG